MPLSNLSSADIQTISDLVKRKEGLQAQIAKIDMELNAFQGGPSVVRREKRTPTKKRAAKKRGRRGALKELIMAELAIAGGEGVTVKELARKLGVNRSNIYTWFNTTGSSVTEIKKLAPATYALTN